MSKSVADVLNEAANLIEHEGWTRGDYFREGRFCLLGAISEEADAKQYSPACALVQRVVDVRLYGGSLANWNDAQRTKKPVVRALREAAQLAAQEATHGV
jgi:hypothetical protein